MSEAITVAYIDRIERDLRALIAASEAPYRYAVDTVSEASAVLTELRSMRDELESLISALRREAEAADTALESAAEEAAEEIGDAVEELSEAGEEVSESVEEVVEEAADETLPDILTDSPPVKQAGLWDRKLIG